MISVENREPKLAALALCVLAAPLVAGWIVQSLASDSNPHSKAGAVHDSRNTEHDERPISKVSDQDSSARFKIPLAKGFSGSADCLLAVANRVLIDGRCDAETDSFGGLTIYDNRDSPTYFAMALDGEGYWNGSAYSTHAQTALGRHEQHGGCWTNLRSQICASSAKDSKIDDATMSTASYAGESEPRDSASISDGKIPEGKERTYTNVRYRYSICYPEDMLRPQPEASNGDGRAFLGRNGVELLVFGSNNIDNRTAQQMMRAAINRYGTEGSKIAYQWIGANSYVISTRSESDITYEKTMLVQDEAITFRLTYPAEVAPIWDKVAQRLNRCFKSLL